MLSKNDGRQTKLFRGCGPKDYPTNPFFLAIRSLGAEMNGRADGLQVSWPPCWSAEPLAPALQLAETEAAA